jgi:hypothetical protein
MKTSDMKIRAKQELNIMVERTMVPVTRSLANSISKKVQELSIQRRSNSSEKNIKF